MEAGGYVSLFVSAFAAATILPFSSEAVLSALVVGDGFQLWHLVVVASIGNTLGSSLNWGIGRYFRRWRRKKWFPISTETLGRASRWFRKYGLFSLLFSWVPILGEPLTAAAGIFRVRFVWFLCLVAVGKTARYIVVAMVAERAFA